VKEPLTKEVQGVRRQGAARSSVAGLSIAVAVGRRSAEQSAELRIPAAAAAELRIPEAAECTAASRWSAVRRSAAVHRRTAVALSRRPAQTREHTLVAEPVPLLAARTWVVQARGYREEAHTAAGQAARRHRSLGPANDRWSAHRRR
jgi:hypothetical protein